jgi:CheY-like chemotaxis protein
LTVGPVAATSARAWLERAESALASLRTERDAGIPWDVMDAYAWFVSSWADHVCTADEPFLWSADVDADLVRRVALHWARLTGMIRSGRVSLPRPATPETKEFSRALLDGVTEALESDGVVATAFAATDAPPVPPEAAPTRVLLVDDDDEIRLLLRIWLERDVGFSVVGECCDGHDAIELARRTECDVMVLDVALRGMSGLDALPLIRATTPDCAVVVCSAGDHRAEALGAGAVAYLSKPAPLGQVIAAVRAARPWASMH